MTISALLAPSLLQPLSSSSKVVPLQKLQQPLQALQQSTASTSSSSASAQLAKDTYTPSSQIQTTQGSDALSNTSSSTATLAGLVKNQTISGSSAVRQVLLNAVAPYVNGNEIKAAWDDIGVAVKAGDYSDALTALGNYTTQLTNADYDTSLVKNPVDALESALQGGNQAEVQTAFTAFTSNTPEVLLSAGNLVYTGDAQEYAAVTGKMVVPALTDELQKVGYTASNAAAEANAIVLGIMIDDATIQLNSGPTTDLSQVDQSIADLAKGAAQSTDTNMLSNIIVGLSHANSVTAMESTLTQLDSKYGTAAQGAGAGNASQATVSVSA